MKAIDRYFGVTVHGSSYKTEVMAGITTFVTMAYIIIVHPKILEAAGFTFGASMVATIISAFFGTLLMGVYAKRPFAIAPYMGENAFIAYTVVNLLGFSWQQALAAIFISGIIFTLLTLFKIRSWLANSIPESMKIAFSVGIGLFLTFIGLNETGIVTLGNPGAPVHAGDFSKLSVMLAIAGFLMMGILMVFRVKAAILFGIILITILAVVFGEVSLPDKLVSLPPDISPIFLKLDFSQVFTWGMFPVILVVFVMGFVDTIGTLMGIAYKAGMVDDKGELPEIEKPMLCDALTTVAGSLLGTTTCGAFIESATGIEAGGKTGLVSVVTALLFLTALFFAPLFTIVPAFAYGPALIIVGMLMLSPVVKLNFTDLTELIPSFVIITFMCFTYNLGLGMTAGFVAYVLVKSVSGKIKEISSGMWILAVLSLMFFIFYPY
ncbi:MAG: NCS2 family permease [Sphingobacteriales bacterium]|nr:NCS2 family permease [Sphingobacteriales bacterium]